MQKPVTILAVVLTKSAQETGLSIEGCRSIFILKRWCKAVDWAVAVI
jgi:hypothetical protein